MVLACEMKSDPVAASAPHLGLARSCDILGR
jgi:hypothetical protein